MTKREKKCYETLTTENDGQSKSTTFKFQTK